MSGAGERKTIVISGADRPGVTAGALEILARHSAQVLELGQAVVSGDLSLFFSIQGADRELLRDLVFWGQEKDLRVRWRGAGRSRARTTAERLIVTLLAAPRLPTPALASVTATLAQHGLNISFIRRTGEPPLDCLELTVTAQKKPPSALLRQELLSLAKEHGVDIAVQPDGVRRWAKRLVALDMDSTLILDEIIDELAQANQVGQEVRKITEEAMEGRLDFRTSLCRRVALLKGLDARLLPRLAARVRVTPGAPELIRCLRKLGCKTAVISGGFDFAASPLAERLGIDHVFANRLEVKRGRLTGRVVGAIVDAEGKARILRALATEASIPLDQVVAVGDGANDLPMLSSAGLGIAFNAKPKVRSRASVAINTRDLRSVLYLMGLTENGIRELV